MSDLKLQCRSCRRYMDERYFTLDAAGRVATGQCPFCEAEFSILVRRQCVHVGASNVHIPPRR